ncbi:transmembrane protein, putative (macronuclear) [Tetrahymena thermophila SB210]|uniref:Transmembrane protein, putative n=1 Tax=Tetrahymena thermophila (strain SB210) TaxID=312017 RepID=I7MM92_TETTS|nr:transmembrane protein, putative [Tetrahymena thermophila SB210]EAS04395.4 transmembrane protein, putative [Tetrahymena thermophila SB210]|eukprot:XP_001024640.4 transmembrane protein, putative [Tetrahymena thermophila SB210]
MIKQYILPLLLIQLPLLVNSQGQLNIQCFGENQSPIYIKQDYSCKNDVDYPFYFIFDQRDIKISVSQADYHKKYSVSDGGISITAKDTNNQIQTFNLTSIEIYTPGRHRRLYKNMYEDVYQSVIPDVELVFYMKAQSTTNQQENSENGQAITQAAVSFLFNRQGKQNMSWYLEGSFLLSPFANNQQTININPSTDFQKYFSLKYNHGFFQYHGSQIAVNCAQENVNWFVFDEIFLLQDDVYQYFYQSYGQQNILLGALRDVQQFNKNPIIKVGCFDQQYEKIYVNSNYGFWGYLVILTIYFFSAYFRPNYKNIYQNEYRNNLKTQIPLYSIFKVEHRVYFNKNSRTTLLFTQITFQMFIQCILIQQNSSQIFSFVIFSFVSVFISWPPCFLLGYLNFLNYKKFKIILDSQIKIIKASEHNKDDEEFIQQIEKSQFQSHTYTYIFYTICMGLMICFWIVSSLIMQNWSDQNYINWAISVPIMIIIDLLIDILIVKLKLKPQFFALKGYYLDVELTDLIKQDKDIKII